MNDRILYPTADGIAVIIPTGELPIEEVAEKDVPAGVPFVYATAEEDIPSDRDFRNAWEADFTSPDGEGIGAEAWFEAHPPFDPSSRRPADVPTPTFTDAEQP